MGEQPLNPVESFFKEFKNTLNIILGLTVIIGFYMGADNYINNQIDDKINDPKYLSVLSEKLRPFSIVNESGTVIRDHGGISYIHSPNITKGEDGDINKIIIKTKKYLEVAPLLFFMGSPDYTYQSSRTSTDTWTYDVKSPSYLALENSAEPYETLVVIEILF